MNFDNLIEGIFTLISKDSEDPMKQSDMLKAIYENAPDLEKKVMDKIMICVCGYSLDTLINHPENIEEVKA